MRFIARLTKKPTVAKTKHYKGLPPDLTAGEDRRQQMDLPALLVIEEKPDGVFLFRFAEDRRCVGDTWHQSVEEAKHQANFEFENSLSAWQPVPEQVADAVSFGFEVK